MHLLAIAFLPERHDAENWRQHHARPMHEGQRLMHADGSLLFHSRQFRREHLVVSGGEVEAGSQASESRMQIEIRLCRLFDDLPISPFGLGLWPGDERNSHGDRSDEPKRLMHLQHVRALIEHRLFFGVAFDLILRNPEILKGWLRGLILLRVLLGCRRGLSLTFTRNGRGWQIRYFCR